MMRENLENSKKVGNALLTDEYVEKLWEEFEDVLAYEDEDGRLCLHNDWQGWPKGTECESIWHWFDQHHSKGVGWLMNEYESEKDEPIKKEVIVKLLEKGYALFKSEAYEKSGCDILHGYQFEELGNFESFAQDVLGDKVHVPKNIFEELSYDIERTEKQLATDMNK